MFRHPPPISKDQIDLAGRVWDSALEPQCLAMLVLGIGHYPSEVLAAFAMRRWETLGHETQKDVARSLACFCELIRQAGRVPATGKGNGTSEAHQYGTGSAEAASGPIQGRITS